MARIAGSLPELIRKKVDRDVARYCTGRVPEHLEEQIKIGYVVRGNAVTIVERRPAWRDPNDWTAVHVAQLRYEDQRWALYWSDRNNRWHFYDPFEPTPDLSAVLAEIDRDPTGIFWG